MQKLRRSGWQRQRTLVRGRITVRLTCLTGLDSAKLLIQQKQSSWILTCQTGGQLCSDTSPHEVRQCSLAEVIQTVVMLLMLMARETMADLPQESLPTLPITGSLSMSVTQMGRCQSFLIWKLLFEFHSNHRWRRLRCLTIQMQKLASRYRWRNNQLVKNWILTFAVVAPDSVWYTGSSRYVDRRTKIQAQASLFHQATKHSHKVFTHILLTAATALPRYSSSSFWRCKVFYVW